MNPYSALFTGIFVAAVLFAVGLWYLVLFLLAGVALLVAWILSNQTDKKTLTRVSGNYAKQLDFLAKNLPLEAQTALTLRSGEEYVYHLGDVALIESRRAPRITQRSGGAVTFALAKGLYYTGARGSSVSPEPEEELRTIDEGAVTFTTQRAVFVGSKQSREWDFSKLLGWTNGPGMAATLAVSNRQKVSGIQSNSDSDLDPGLLMNITEVVREYGWDTARESCANAAADHRAMGRFVAENPKASQENLEAYQTHLNEQRLAADSEEKDGESSEANPSQALTETSPRRQAPAKHLESLREIEVVGETFYKESFEALRGEFKSEGNTEHVVEVELRNDPDNQYSESGKAVAVFIRNKQVGHVPERLAPKVFDQIEADGGIVTLGARLYLGYTSAEPQKNSVTVTLDSRLVVRA